MKKFTIKKKGILIKFVSKSKNPVVWVRDYISMWRTIRRALNVSNGNIEGAKMYLSVIKGVLENNTIVASDARRRKIVSLIFDLLILIFILYLIWR
ncbi:MAG: hypothetical protein N2999_08060 [Proteobacteria bacterium]|nr:hypothetical protein [Pseudomonadota bacterium]